MAPDSPFRLRPYQQEAAKAVLESILEKKGLTFTVEMARQGGKNELSAQLEVLLLTMHLVKGGNAVKCSPTFKPQTVISMLRLKERLEDFGFTGLYASELGYIIKLGNARQVFLSAEEKASVVGHTADILLEVDEAQDVAKEKYTKDFRPMTSAYNTTTVLYGTTWDETTLLEETKQLNLELEKKDGIKRHFRYDWQEIAKYVPEYQTFVEEERKRLGESHPLFLTQYALLPLRGGGGFLSQQQLALLQGTHAREYSSQPGKTYVAGIDIAGESEVPEDILLTRKGRDATVITIAELSWRAEGEAIPGQPKLKVVSHYSWVGKKHAEVYPRMIDLLKNIWRCQRIAVDATGIGEPIASFLRNTLGSKVLPFVFTQKSKSELGFNLLSAINSGRLKIYQPDGSEEYQQLMFQLERAKASYRANQTMNFFIDPREGHDDFLISLALTVEAAREYAPRKALGFYSV